MSVYYYEKALLLDPASKDIKINLSFAQKMTIDSIERIPQSGFSMWFSKTLNSLSVDGWATRCVGLTFLFVFLFLCYLLSYSESKKSNFAIRIKSPNPDNANQQKVTHWSTYIDAFKALEYLSKQPKVNINKIGITGWSRGGMISLMVAEKRLRDILVNKDLYFDKRQLAMLCRLLLPLLYN